MRNVTLCFLIDGDSVCLAMKKRGFGQGKWNGVGGKVEEGESIKQAALRELREEIGVETDEEHMKNMGNIRFSFNGKPDFSQHMHVFFIRKWRGEPKESDEMEPKWYKKDSLPYDDMWIGDKYWLPKALGDQRIEGEFHFNAYGNKILKFDLRDVE